MYLVNALNFEAKWADQYADYQVSKSMFTEENGNQTDCIITVKSRKNNNVYHMFKD